MNIKKSDLDFNNIPDVNIIGKGSMLKRSINEMDKPAFLCEVDPSNFYNLKIVHCNGEFAKCFNVKSDDILGKSYDFLFHNMDIGYNSEDQMQYTKLLKAVKNFQPISVDIEITDFSDKAKSDNFRINFSINDFNSKSLYCIFTFDKIPKVKNAEDNQNFTSRVLIKNLERSLRSETLLRKVSDLIVSDISVKEVAENIAQILCDYLKVDRCILHDFSEGRTGFIVEYRSSNHVSSMITKADDKKGDKKSLDSIIKYINFQNVVFKNLNTLNRKNTSLTCDDISEDSRFKKIENVCDEFSIVSQLSIVTAVNNKVNGGLYIHQSSSRKWLVEEVELIELIAEQFSMAIDRSYAIDKVMVTNHQLLEKTLELKKALKEEKKIRKMQNEFVAMVSHEFKTPLQIIDSTRELLSRKLKKLLPGDNSADKHLDRIKGGILRLNGLIQSTFNLSKIEMHKGMVEIEKKCFNIKDLIKDVLDKSHNLTLDKNINIVIDINNLPDDYDGDQKLLDHCFTNIIANAIKYSKNDTDVKIIGGIKDNNVFVEVIDNGIGIPKNDLKSIGTKFFRAKNTLAVAGTGIGLYLTKYFVDLHGGSVVVDSKLNVGTTVSILLPL